MFESKQPKRRLARLYKVAAIIAKEYSEGLGSIKQLVYAKRDKHPRIQALYALVNTLYQRKDEIQRLLKKTQLLESESRADPWVIKILITELLYGKKVLSGQTKIEQTIKGYEQIFKAHLSDSIEVPVKDETVSTKPKYVRVNALKKTVEEAIEAFTDEGWHLIRHSDKNDYNGFIEKVAALKGGEFMVDMHVPSLLIFPPRTHFYNHPAYKNGTVILQDKASCLPVHLLAPPPGSTVLDMCAAPGMKTTQLAAALANQGVVYAVERDTKRVGILKHIVGSSEATCVKVINKDVLDCAKKDFPGAEYILVDPSCSGSGMTERSTEAENKDLARLEKLAGFQILILRSALTRYPDAKRVAYSTCSLHPEENEEVVRQVLETNYNFKLVDAKKLLNSAWNSFGSSDYGEMGEFCLYARPDEDLTNGFFVAIFERLEEGEQNKFLNNRISNFKKHLHAADKRKERRLEGKENKETAKSKRGNKNNKEKSVPEDEPNNVEEIENNHIVEDEQEHGLNDNIEFEESVCEKGAKKKKKKKLTENDVECQETVNGCDEIENTVAEKVDKKNKTGKVSSNNDATNDNITIKKKSNKNKHKNATKLEESTEDNPKNDATLENDNPVGENKTKKKKLKHSTESKDDFSIEATLGDNENTKKVKSKKKKRKSCSEVNELIDISKNDKTLESNDNTSEENKPKKKKHNILSEDNEFIEDLKNDEPLDSTEENKPKKKKHKRFSEVNELIDMSKNDKTVESNDNTTEENKPKKKKHNVLSEDNEFIEDLKNDEPLDSTEKNKPKKNKHKRCSENSESIVDLKNEEPLESYDNVTEENTTKKKKRKDCSEASEMNIIKDSQLKKKKRKHCSEVGESLETSENPDAIEFTQKSKKKKKMTSEKGDLQLDD
ncbi:unnamed protein product [Callosobruchus maculatus]|uniref:SAM-dependent MTase RsmB/NOP-type domain-containing protein n=1 Tax=Callosobruchus maculatus TaxID=64391 RepID=A0A653CLM5_CALMS|nr:unnamed protein product [Callosobruchus maculatus]